jgi:DNA polymerase I-like protein with 3'-5' exonuclease and polymerase domains
MFLTAEQLTYAQNDVHYLHRLRRRLSAQLGEVKLATLFRLETALLPIVARMEASGFAIDTDRMRSLPRRLMPGRRPCSPRSV